MNWWTRFCVRHRGSISIFLSIILLPMLWLIGVLVDSSNYNLSKGVVEGAGELTANAALATYDTVLADVYGLFAMSQNMDDLQANLEQYFKNTLEASGLMDEGLGLDLESESGQAAAALVQGMLGLVSPEDLTRDFLDVEYENFTAAGLEGSSLANPEILKSQVVEFMKYRGPAEVGMSLLDSLGVFKKVGEQSKVLKEKMKTEEKVADLAKESKRLYQAITDLDGMIEEFLEAKSGFYGGGLSTVRDCLKEADRIVRENLSDVADVDDLPEMEEAEETVVDGEGNKYPTYDLKGVSAKRLTKSYTIDDAREDLNDALNSFPDKTDRLQSTAAVLDGLTGGDLKRAFENYRSFVDSMEELYVLLLTVEKHGSEEDGGALAEAWVQLGEAYEGVVELFTRRAESYEAELEGDYIAVGQKVRKAVGILEAYQESASALAEADREPTGFFTELADLFGALSNAIDYTIKQVEKVEEAMAAVDSANGKLETEVEKYEGKVAADDFSTGIRSEVQANKNTFSAEDLKVLKEQLNAFKTYLGDENSGEIGRLEHECTLYDQKLLSIKLPGSDKTLGKNVLGYYENYTGAAPGYRLISAEQTMSPGCYIKLIGSGTLRLSNGEAVVPPPYYTYMSCNYSGDGTAKEDSNLTQSVKNVSSEAEETTKATEASTAGEGASSGSILSDVPSGSAGGAGEEGSFELGSGNTAILGQLGSILSLVTDLVGDTSGFVENGRDNLLVTQYVDSNFSNAVTEKRKGAADATQDEKEPATMTNVAINTANNPMYGCEMEYIIYGDKGDQAKKIFFFFTVGDPPGPAVNISYAKNNILAVRLACNCVFAISNQNINNLTLAPAMAIQTATGGIFPYKVAQVVLDVCLAYAESLSDLKRLMDGKKVELIKTYDDWTMKPETVLDGEKMSELAKETIQEKAAQAQEIVTNNVQDLIDDMSGKLTEGSSTVLLRINGEITTTISAGVASCKATISSLISDQIGTMIVEGVQKGSGHVWKAADLRQRLEGAVEPYLSGLAGSPLASIAVDIKSAVIDKIVSESAEVLAAMNQKTGEAIEKCTKLVNQKIEDALSEAETIIEDKIDELTNQINEEITTLVNENAEKLKNATEEKVAEVSAKASEELSNKVNGKLNEIFPKNQQKVSLSKDAPSKNSGVGEIFKFSYQDYLRLFLFLELNKDSDGVMLRLADVIQVNTGQGLSGYAKEKLGKSEGESAHGKGKDFRMSEAYTYVRVGADVTLNPLFLSQKLFQFNGEEDLGRWSYHFETVKGY